jgi:hypothetical protein
MMLDSDTGKQNNAKVEGGQKTLGMMCNLLVGSGTERGEQEEEG